MYEQDEVLATHGAINKNKVVAKPEHRLNLCIPTVDFQIVSFL